MKILDRVANRLGYTKPGRRTYAGARIDRLTAWDWRTSLMSPDAEIWSSLRTLRSRSRELVRDNPHAASLARVWVENVVGPNGLRHVPMVENREGDLSLRVNDVLTDGWEAWSDASLCSLDQRFSWYDVQRLAARGDFVDGEFLALIHEGANINAHGFAVQVLDPDQLDDTYTGVAPNGVNEIRMGVELDPAGRRVAFHIWDRYPYDIAGRGAVRKRIPASNVLHWFEASRPGQTRGVPRLASVLYQLNMMRGGDEAVAVAHRMAAAAAFVWEQNVEGADLTDINGDKIEAPIPMDIEPGQGVLLPKGVTAKMIQPEQPGANYDSASKKWLRDIGAGAGIAYHTFTGDLSDTNFTSGRMGENQQRDMFRGQHRRMASGVCLPIRNRWLPNAMLMDAIALPSQNASRYTACRFDGRGWDFVKPSEDIATASMELALGITSRQREAAKKGYRLEDVLRENAQDHAMAEALGVELHDPLPQGVQASTDAPAKPGDPNDE